MAGKGSLRLLWALSLLWLVPALACGSFAPRAVPTPTVSVPDAFFAPTSTVTTGEPEAGVQPIPQDTTVALLATDTPVAEPTATFTPTPPPGTALQVGQSARVTAPAGLNMRTEPRSGAALVLQLATNQRVTVVEGPTSADNFTWWRVDNGQGNVGWVAERDAETVWLSPQLGEAQPVNRAPRLDDRVSVTMPAGGQLSIRALPGPDAPLVVRANPGQQFTVLDGPQSAGGFTWYRIRSDDGQVEGWAADGDGTTRWLSPLE
ncbi:MAG: SH3 domain-containing protein [Caldilineaceae bacterium]|nr:SH3 domain-containing protein [Caldilineaceae bacterium]